jgi:hypothetical protein
MVGFILGKQTLKTPFLKFATAFSASAVFKINK